MKISKIIEDNKKAIILLNTEKMGENKQNIISIRGTGFIIFPHGKFITCAHIYKKIPPNELQYLGVYIPERTDEKNITYYKRYNVELIKMDEENDIALMNIISDGEKKFETIFKGINNIDNSKIINEGEEIIYSGYPLATELLSMGFGITMTTNKCIISSVKRRGIDGSLHFFLIDTHTNNGSSGSPVFSLENGKIIGIVSGKISARVPVPYGIPDGKIDIPANMGICRPAKYINDLLK